jgi:DNA polymerase (family 10)
MQLHKNMTNKEIAKLLRVISSVYELKSEPRFKIIAYDRAATTIERSNREVKELWQKGKLETLPGIGPNIASHLQELFKVGQVSHFKRILKNLSPAVFVLLDIPGVGVKTASKLCENLKIKSPQKALAQLKKAAEKGKIRTLEGFGQESEKNILEGLKEAQKRQKETRIPLVSAWESTQEIIAFMKEEKAALRIDPLGSLRRMAATVGDIDLAVSTKKPRKVIDRFLDFPNIKKVLASGTNTVRVILKNDQQVDLKTSHPEAYGAMLQHFTGSKQHNIRLREIALSRKLSLSEYGIKKAQKGQKKPETAKFKDEEGFYRFLKLDWIPPELRENNGEIEAAQNHQLPRLIKLLDIKGDLHLHSNFPIEPSHDLGQNTIPEIIKKAKALDYQYLALSEHNPSLSQHSEREILAILKRKKEAVEKNSQNFNLFNSLEVDIRPNGQLAISQEALATLDFAIAGIHSSFRMSRNEMTERILKGLEEPKVKILAHPTGRMLGKRESLRLDWDRLFTFCAKNKKALEINSCPSRLDLPDFLVREAIKKGVRIVISTDAHSLSEMETMKYGVAVARRGWAGKEPILNTLEYGKIKKWLLNQR